MYTPDKRIEQHRNVILAAKNAGVGKIVYTSVQGADSGTAFSTVIQSNRQTEQDVRESGLGSYEGISMGALDNPSQFAEAAGREHQS